MSFSTCKNDFVNNENFRDLLCADSSEISAAFESIETKDETDTLTSQFCCETAAETLSSTIVSPSLHCSENIESGCQFGSASMPISECSFADSIHCDTIAFENDLNNQIMHNFEVEGQIPDEKLNIELSKESNNNQLDITTNNSNKFLSLSFNDNYQTKEFNIDKECQTLAKPIFHVSSSREQNMNKSNSSFSLVAKLFSTTDNPVDQSTSYNAIAEQTEEINIYSVKPITSKRELNNNKLILGVSVKDDEEAKTIYAADNSIPNSKIGNSYQIKDSTSNDYICNTKKNFSRTSLRRSRSTFKCFKQKASTNWYKSSSDNDLRTLSIMCHYNCCNNKLNRNYLPKDTQDKSYNKNCINSQTILRKENAEVKLNNSNSSIASGMIRLENNNNEYIASFVADKSLDELDLSQEINALKTELLNANLENYLEFPKTILKPEQSVFSSEQPLEYDKIINDFGRVNKCFKQEKTVYSYENNNKIYEFNFLQDNVNEKHQDNVSAISTEFKKDPIFNTCEMHDKHIQVYSFKYQESDMHNCNVQNSIKEIQQEIAAPDLMLNIDFNKISDIEESQLETEPIILSSEPFNCLDKQNVVSDKLICLSSVVENAEYNEQADCLTRMDICKSVKLKDSESFKDILQSSTSKHYFGELNCLNNDKSEEKETRKKSGSLPEIYFELNKSIITKFNEINPKANKNKNEMNILLAKDYTYSCEQKNVMLTRNQTLVEQKSLNSLFDATEIENNIITSINNIKTSIESLNDVILFDNDIIVEDLTLGQRKSIENFQNNVPIDRKPNVGCESNILQALYEVPDRKIDNFTCSNIPDLNMNANCNCSNGCKMCLEPEKKNLVLDKEITRTHRSKKNRNKLKNKIPYTTSDNSSETIEARKVNPRQVVRHVVLTDDDELEKYRHDSSVTVYPTSISSREANNKICFPQITSTNSALSKSKPKASNVFLESKKHKKKSYNNNNSTKICIPLFNKDSNSQLRRPIYDSNTSSSSNIPLLKYNKGKSILPIIRKYSANPQRIIKYYSESKRRNNYIMRQLNKSEEYKLEVDSLPCYSNKSIDEIDQHVAVKKSEPMMIIHLIEHKNEQERTPAVLQSIKNHSIISTCPNTHENDASEMTPAIELIQKPSHLCVLNFPLVLYSNQIESIEAISYNFPIISKIYDDIQIENNCKYTKNEIMSSPAIVSKEYSLQGLDAIEPITYVKPLKETIERYEIASIKEVTFVTNIVANVIDNTSVYDENQITRDNPHVIQKIIHTNQEVPMHENKLSSDNDASINFDKCAVKALSRNGSNTTFIINKSSKIKQGEIKVEISEPTHPITFLHDYKSNKSFIITPSSKNSSVKTILDKKKIEMEQFNITTKSLAATRKKSISNSSQASHSGRIRNDIAANIKRQTAKERIINKETLMTLKSEDRPTIFKDNSSKAKLESQQNNNNLNKTLNLSTEFSIKSNEGRTKLKQPLLFSINQIITRTPFERSSSNNSVSKGRNVTIFTKSRVLNVL